MPVTVEGGGIHRCLKEDMNVNAITKLLDHTQKVALPSFPLNETDTAGLSPFQTVLDLYSH